MGVTGLWTVLQPCARPIKIETLNKKRLAVDASIWIYQFLKAVRDKEGNALRNSHIVGFFRRICKLLFIGIKPVFVFDGGAPALKRQTISGRRARREGRREDAARTAGKLLAIQLQRAAEHEAKRRKDAPPPQREQEREREQEQEQIPETLVYADEILQSQHERTQNRTFRKKDQYHLPDLGMSLSEMGGPNDPRVMSLEELEDYARQFDRGEDINVYDFSKIDFDGYFFQSLPPADRYNILNAARLRSRLRMGYSKEQLDSMFPDRMAFSKFQIERVRERNDLTQRLMNLNGMNDDSSFGGANRIAGEKGREYVLVKNDGVEGGWALGVVTNKDEGKAHKPIDVDLPIRPAEEFEDVDDDDDFEDVPIEGLNRLPKPKPDISAQEKDGREYISSELAKRRRKFYNSRQDKPARPKHRKLSPVDQDPDSLFLAEDDEDMEWEDVQNNEADLVSEEAGDSLEDEQLQKAIALSLQQSDLDAVDEDDEDDPVREVFQQERAKDTNPFAKARGSGLAIARLANQRSSKLAPKEPFEGSDSEDEMDLRAALAESRRSKRAVEQRPSSQKVTSKPLAPAVKPASNSTNASGFDGPLPFEKLNLGNSLLGKKKMEKIEQDTAGGFEKNDTQKKTAEPLPPWFSGERDINQELTQQRQKEAKEWAGAHKEHEAQFPFQTVPRLRKQDTKEVIDLDASQSQSQSGNQVITLDSEDEDDSPKDESLFQHTQPKMNDLAEKIRTEPPQPLEDDQGVILNQNAVLKSVEEKDDGEPIDWSESENEAKRRAKVHGKAVGGVDEPLLEREKSSSEEFEDVPMQIEPALAPEPSKSLSPEFEDVPMHNVETSAQETSNLPSLKSTGVSTPAEQPRRTRRESSAVLEGPDDLEIPIVPHENVGDDNMPGNDSDQYSDPEDEDLFASLAAEAEEHARFAQELNNNTTSRINFDEELKQLRAQQKKDKRDADEVTQTMVAECQHLLTLFGLPYITAPMEAEAQCAELVHLGLVDGIVTDDSDTFLFGGTRVYKNMFNAAKFVECYLSQDLASEFNLTRENLIAIAQLLGSDYCPGIPGIGPVTALEVLSEFPNLQDFKEWWTGVQDASIPKSADASSPFRRRFRRSQATKLFLPTIFPDPRVADAYLHPEVDTDPEPFQWGVPDLAALRSYLNSQIGWSWERTDEVLVPVIRDMNRREKEGTQSNITRYFEGGVGAGAFAPRVKEASGKGRGSRLGAALSRLAERDGVRGGEGTGEAAVGGGSGGVDAEVVAPAKDAKRGKRKTTSKFTSASAQHESSAEEDEQSDELYEAPKKKKARKTRTSKAIVEE